MIEVLAGDGFINALFHNNLSGKNTYSGNEYEVWELEESDVKKLLDIPDDEWKPEWGWFRYRSERTIINWQPNTFIVNGQKMLGWCTEDVFDYTKVVYNSLTNYMCFVIGVSKEDDVSTVAADLAELNRLSLGELFTKYQPIKMKMNGNNTDDKYKDLIQKLRDSAVATTSDSEYIGKCSYGWLLDEAANVIETLVNENV